MKSELDIVERRAESSEPCKIETKSESRDRFTTNCSLGKNEASVRTRERVKFIVINTLTQDIILETDFCKAWNMDVKLREGL